MISDNNKKCSAGNSECVKIFICLNEDGAIYEKIWNSLYYQNIQKHISIEGRTNLKLL